VPDIRNQSQLELTLSKTGKQITTRAINAFVSNARPFVGSGFRSFTERLWLRNWHNGETVFRFCFQVIMLVIPSIASQAYGQSTNAPLYLSINGDGNVSPLTNGELLVVGQTYSMTATPDTGFAFSGWQPVNVFTFAEFVIDTNGNTLPPVFSTVAAPVATFTYEASLSFVMQPVTVIYDVPGVRTVTEGSGWQANFEPVVLNIQLGDAAVILSWPTNFHGLRSAIHHQS